MQLKNPFFCRFLPDQSEENESKDLQSSPESGVGAEEGELVEASSAAEGDDGVTEPTKAGEAQSKAVGNPAPLPGNPAVRPLLLVSEA